MSRSKQPNEPNRRVFLRTVAFGGAAGVLTGTGVSIAAPMARGGATAADTPQPEEARSYHLTDHIREYYRKAAF